MAFLASGFHLIKMKLIYQNEVFHGGKQTKWESMKDNFMFGGAKK